MKRMIAVILAAACAFALCACGDTGDGGKTGAKNEYKADYGELYYASGDVKFGIFDPADEVLAALGEPVSTFESNSCAYQGKDMFYYYDGFEVLVNDVDGTRRVTGITLADDTVSTPQGVRIGMELDEALALLQGLEYTQTGDTYKFTVGSTLFRLQADSDGTVKAAEYSVAANDSGE